MIALIDYGMGNLGSVGKALEAAGAEYRLVTAPEEAARCEALLLPGVGNFGDGMRNLASRGWVPFLRQWAQLDRPMLGICLGMQMLFDSSEEAPGVEGLGIVPGQVVRFPEAVGKVPHIGWNAMRVTAPVPEVFADVARVSEYFYFVHSFYVVPSDRAWSCGLCEYGGLEFTAAVARGHLAATQFHPEKSQQAGLSILKRFAKWGQTK